MNLGAEDIEARVRELQEQLAASLREYKHPEYGDDGRVLGYAVPRNTRCAWFSPETVRSVVALNWLPGAAP